MGGMILLYDRLGKVKLKYINFILTKLMSYLVVVPHQGFHLTFLIRKYNTHCLLIKI